MPNRNTTNSLQAGIVTSMFSARLYGVLPDTVRPVLEAVKPLPRYGAAGHEITISRNPYYSVNAKGVIHFKAGLVPRVKAHLEHLGFHVEVRNLVTWHTLCHANHAMQERGNETIEDQQFLDAVADTPRGLVVVHAEAEVAWLIAKLRSFLPSARMLIVAANAERVERFYCALSKLRDQPVRRTFEGLLSMPVRTYVCTQAEFAMHSAQDWNTIVFTDAESALAATSQKTLGRMFRYAQDNLQDLFTYCFVRDNEPLGPRAQLRLEAVCGGEIYRQPVPGGPLPAVTVLIARAAGCPSLPRHTNHEVKHQCSDARKASVVTITARSARRLSPLTPATARASYTATHSPSTTPCNRVRNRCAVWARTCPAGSPTPATCVWHGTTSPTTAARPLDPTDGVSRTSRTGNLGLRPRRRQGNPVRQLPPWSRASQEHLQGAGNG